MNSEDAFRAKVLWVYSTVLGSLGLTVLILISLLEGGVPARRLVTVILAAMLMAVVVLMRYAKHLSSISVYVCLISTALIFYVDFNNSSITGPTTVLWVIPFILMSLLFSGLSLFLSLIFSLSLFLFNVFALYQGWLPEPIIKEESWSFMQALYMFCAAIMIVTCTRGMTNLSKTHLKELQKEVKNKKKRIKKMNELKIQAESSAHSKSIFLATMSHELRTPLNSVIGNAQLLARADLPDKHQTKVNDIALAGNLLLILINDILDFSKLEVNELNLIEEPYDVTQQINELCRMMTPRLKQDVRLELSLPENRIYINGDQNRLSQVLMNLLSNAMKFTDAGVINVSLEKYGDSGIKISIEDSGIGIKAEDCKRLFTKFSQFTNDSIRNMEGTGLGLAISMGLVKHMGGDIDVTSEINKGSCFSIVLPQKRIPDLDLTIAREGAIVKSTVSLRGYSVLVVDDIAMNCMMLEAMLAEFDADCLLSVNSGEQAVDYITQHIDTRLILMDMRMPGMSGVETTNKIRELNYQGSIIAVTANASEQDRQACIDAGMNDFIAKPVTMVELERVLSKIINHF